MHADEGMWLFNNPPLKQLKEKYGFEPTAEWLEHVRSSSVRFNSGGSGSFVSPDGLVMTNHHVGADALQKLCTTEKDYFKDGFYAKTHDEEIKCRRPGAERPHRDRGRDRAGQRRGQARHGRRRRPPIGPPRRRSTRSRRSRWRRPACAATSSRSTRAGSTTSTASRSTPTSASSSPPSSDIAFFGGDPDNFEYPALRPRRLLLPRLRERQAGQVEHYLKWSADGAQGRRTGLRLRPPRPHQPAEHGRRAGVPARHRLPVRCSSGSTGCEVLLEYGYSGRSEQARQAKDELFGIQNSRKARIGGLAGLLDPELMARKAKAEKRAARARSTPTPRSRPLRRRLGQDRRGAEGRGARSSSRYNLLEARRRVRLASSSASPARSSALAEELAKPNAERLREYRDVRPGVAQARSCSPTRRSTTTSRRPSWPTR